MSSASSAIDQILNFEKSDAEDYYKILGCDESSSVSSKYKTHFDARGSSLKSESSRFENAYYRRVDLRFHRCADRSSKSAPSTRPGPCSCTLIRTTATKRVRPSSNYLR
jgi:hypothetical protein